MTDIDAETLRGLHEAATPGPWQGYSEPDVGLTYSLFSGIPMKSGFGPVEPLSAVEIDLIAYLRNAVPSILALLDENARLKAELLEQRRTDAVTMAGFSEACGQRDEALRRCERLSADAARYVWLRDHSVPPHNFYISVPDEFAGVKYNPSEVDAYIDEARAALEGDER